MDFFLQFPLFHIIIKPGVFSPLAFQFNLVPSIRRESYKMNDGKIKDSSGFKNTKMLSSSPLKY